MRKPLVASVLWALVLGAAVPSILAKDKTAYVFVNLGTEINMVPQYWSLGIQADLQPMKLVMVSPEVNAWFGMESSGGAYLVPAILFNVKLGVFFAGAGPAALLHGSDYSPEVRPKFNIGYRTRHFKLLVGAIPRNGYVSGLVTAGVGF